MSLATVCFPYSLLPSFPLIFLPSFPSLPSHLSLPCLPPRNVETTRSVVKKLRFAPGKGNIKMIALYNTRIDIREGVRSLSSSHTYSHTHTYTFTLTHTHIHTHTHTCTQDGVLGQLKWGSKDASPHPSPVEDADWATSDKPVLLTSDCCVRVYDVKLQHCQTLISTQSFAGDVTVM